MKTSLKWLKEYAELTASCKDLTEKLTLAGLEVEGIDAFGEIPPGVVVAQIVSRDRHPNADKLSVCQVDDGSGELLQIVCGADNCDAGKKVPLARIGTALGDLKLKKVKLRGVESSGMLCSSKELGLDSDQAGLMELPADAPVGAELDAYLGSDVVVDWEVTPNRPDWLSHIGIAREAAAVYDRRSSFRLPEVRLHETADPVQAAAAVEVLDPDLCPRYIARVVRNVKIQPSPAWMQEKLRAVGIRPINNVVDITNFVMMECGQPLHAFDYERLAGHRIIVRRSRAGETIRTLDGQLHKLQCDNLLIADAERGVALAGVMGGENSEISDCTTTVLLESAAFTPPNIRATAKSIGLSTDSSYRFERGVGLEMVEFASRRAAALICELAGGELLRGSIDVYGAPFSARSLSCRVGRTNQLLGVNLSSDVIANCFERLQIPVIEKTEDLVTVSVPSFRLDLEREVDLIEEVARIYGLNNIPAEPVAAHLGGSMGDDAYYDIEEARAQLLAAGLNEAVNYSFLSEAAAIKGTATTAGQLIRMSNPLSQEAGCLRPSILPSLIETVARNVAHGTHDIAIFEFGRVFTGAPDLPEERTQAGIVLSGRVHPERFGPEKQRSFDFYDIKGILEGWMDTRRLTPVIFAPVSHPAFADGVCADILVGGARVGIAGVIDKAMTDGIRLKHDVIAALIELDTVMSLVSKPKVYSFLPQFPSTTRDISMVAPQELTNQTITDTVCSLGSRWIVAVDLVDVFVDEQVLGAGKRGLTYSLTYRSSEGTLTDEQVNQAHNTLRDQLAGKLSVEFR